MTRGLDAHGYSEQQCTRLCERGLDAADFFGMANCVDVEGCATSE